MLHMARILGDPDWRRPLVEQFKEEKRAGRMVTLPRARAKALDGDRLREVPQAAIGESDGSVRTSHDGTHGPGIKPTLRIRDQLRNPRGGELRYVLSRCSTFPGPTFGLTADVSKAHRRYKHLQRDWG